MGSVPPFLILVPLIKSYILTLESSLWIEEGILQFFIAHLAFLSSDDLFHRMTRHRTTLYAIYLAAATLFTGVYIRITMADWQAHLQTLTDFGANRPFQFRVLQPLIVHIIHRLLPIDVVPIHFFITWLVIVAILFLFRQFLVHTDTEGGGDTTRFDLATLAILYPMFWNYAIFGLYYYPCDLPSIAFFLLGINLILTRRLGFYYAGFLLATINRETSCLIAVAFAILVLKEFGWRKTVLHLTAQVGIWIGTLATIHYIFRDSPGVTNQFTLDWNWQDILSILSGHSLVFLFAIFMVFGGMHWFAILGYRLMPPILKRLLFIAPLMFCAMLFFGLIFEVRVYNELVPLFAASGIFWLRDRSAASTRKSAIREFPRTVVS